MSFKFFKNRATFLDKNKLENYEKSFHPLFLQPHKHNQIDNN